MNGQEGQERRERQEGKSTLPAVGAAVFYTLAFFALTWPAIARFGTHWFTDEVDGLQNVWNVWWVQYAVTVLHQNPWHTTFLHYPYGTSLVGHTLNPFNGFAAIALSPFLSPVAVYNTLVTFGFVGAGVTAFLLARYLTEHDLASLLAGYVFTFSSFHFAHAEGHLQLVSLEWLPLFVLLWLVLLDRPTIWRGTAAALVLGLVILCDYYYFLYCVMAGAIILAWWAARNGLHALVDPHRRNALTAFAIVALATSGLLAAALVRLGLRDPLTGIHPASEYSLDLLSPFIYGAHWRFASITSPFWRRLPANPHESSVHLGFSVIALVLYAWHERRALKSSAIGLFATLLAVFLVLALGPSLQIAGKAVLGDRPLLPYAWLQMIFPPLALSGVPIRMMVMVTLSAAVLAAFGVARLARGSARDRAAAVLLAGLLVVETLPKPIPTIAVPTPGYVETLRTLPGSDGVLDMSSTPSVVMFQQTLHHKPLAFGYLARVPESVAAQDRALEDLVRRGEFDRLWRDYRIRYLVTDRGALVDLGR